MRLTINIIYSHRIENKKHTVQMHGDPKSGVKRSTQLAIKRNKIVNVAASTDHTLCRRKVWKRGIEAVLKLSPKGRGNGRYHESALSLYVKRKETDKKEIVRGTVREGSNK
jgi:hypothetical protein